MKSIVKISLEEVSKYPPDSWTGSSENTRHNIKRLNESLRTLIEIYDSTPWYNIFLTYRIQSVINQTLVLLMDQINNRPR